MLAKEKRKTHGGYSHDTMTTPKSSVD